jgi:hypothetical protein
MKNITDARWVLLEENSPYILQLTKDEAEVEKQKMKMKFPDLSYTLFYDEYYEFSEILDCE